MSTIPTNTVNIYSDTPVMGLASAATRDVIDYTLSKGTFSAPDVRPILYARYGMEMGGEVGRFIPGSGTAFEVAGAIVDHSAAGLQSENVRR